MVKRQGYLYIAFGESYVEEATISATSLKSCCPNAIICIVTSNTEVSPVFDLNVHQDSCSKLEGMLYTPFENTIYLDTDTYFCESCENLFGLLSQYDICMAEAPNEDELFDGYRPLNSGVVVYSRKSFDMLRLAAEEYSSLNSGKIAKNDQHYLARAIFSCGIRVHVLSAVWNFRSCFFVDLKGSVKIIHDRGKDMNLIKRRVNSRLNNRCWNPHTQMLVSDPNHLTIHL